MRRATRITVHTWEKKCAGSQREESGLVRDTRRIRIWESQREKDGREGERQRETLSWARTQKSHNPDSINVWLLFYCCNIIQLRAVSYFKQRPSISLIYDLPHTYTASLALSLTHSQTQKMVHSHSGGKKTGNDIRIKKEVMTSTKSVCERDRESERVRESGTQSTGALEGWVTSYLFGMMKIFPSRQPFVALVPGTACQICFSSPSCLHTAAITNTSTHTVCLPCRPQQVCSSVTVVMCVCVCVCVWGEGVTK